MPLVGIFPVGTHKSIARVVEHIEESLVKRQSGTENGTDNNTVGRQTDTCHAQRRSDLLRLIVERLRNLKGFIFANTLDVVTEKKAVLLILTVAHLGQVSVNNGVLIA